MYLPWWVLLAGLAASAFAVYVLLGRTRAGDSPWVLFPLTAVLAPVLFLGAALAGITLAVLISMLLEDQKAAPTGPPEAPPRTERTGTETPEGTGAQTTLERTVPPPSPSSASPSASPSASASASASPSASPAASSSASPSP